MFGHYLSLALFIKRVYVTRALMHAWLLDPVGKMQSKGTEDRNEFWDKLARRARCFNYGVGSPLPSRLRGLLHVSQLPPRLQSLEKRTFNGKFN